MASFGAKYPYFCPVVEEPEALYKGGPVRIGRLVKAGPTVNLASGKLFADNALAESVDKFTSGSIANVGDDPPAGGLAYFKKLMRLYKGCFYPLVEAALGDTATQTKADSITGQAARHLPYSRVKPGAGASRKR